MNLEQLEAEWSDARKQLIAEAPILYPRLMAVAKSDIFRIMAVSNGLTAIEAATLLFSESGMIREAFRIYQAAAIEITYPEMEARR